MQLYVLSEAPGSIHKYTASVTVSVHTFCLINPQTFNKNYVKLFLGSLVGMGRMACFCSSAIAENTRMRVYLGYHVMSETLFTAVASALLYELYITKFPYYW